MINTLRRAGAFILAGLAVLGYLAIAQTDRLTAAGSALNGSVGSAPVQVSCVPSSDAMASWLRSQGFPAQAAKNFARPEPGCDSGAVSAACTTQFATALRAKGISVLAIKNLTRPADRD